MTRAWMAAIVLALAPAALAQDDEEALQSLIEQNVKSRGLILQELRQDQYAIPQQLGLAPAPSPLPAARIWVHVRAADELGTAEKINERLAGGLSVGDGTRSVEPMPVQEVDYGPLQSQVRFFKEVDRATAEAARDAVAGLVPNVATLDLTAEYGAADWIEPGHIEIWLAPAR